MTIMHLCSFVLAICLQLVNMSGPQKQKRDCSWRGPYHHHQGQDRRQQNQLFSLHLQTYFTLQVLVSSSMLVLRPHAGWRGAMGYSISWHPVLEFHLKQLMYVPSPARSERRTNSTSSPIEQRQTNRDTPVLPAIYHGKRLERTIDSRCNSYSKHLTQFCPSYMFTLCSQNNEISSSVAYDTEVWATPLHLPAN